MRMIPGFRSCVAAGLFALACLLPCVLAAADMPALTGRVVDNADMIDAPRQEALVSRLEAFEKKTSIQVVVATIPSLDGEAIEPYANRLFRTWGLGQASDNNGVLLLIAKNDRKMRIEVGYGLEGTLTDLHSKLIIENTLVPAFRAGDFSGGIVKAADQIVAVLDGNADAVVPPVYHDQEPVFSDNAVGILFFAIWGTLFFGGFAMAILPPLFGRKIGPNRYKWLGMEFNTASGSSSSSGSSGWSSSSSSSSSSGGFSGGGGSSGGGGASGSW